MKIILSVDLQDENYRLPIAWVRRLWQVARQTLETEAARPIANGLEVSLLLTNDEAIHQLNKAYRQVDRATDVLSFPMYQAAEPLLPHTSLGDIVISLDAMANQAKAYGHSQTRELCFLFAHGLLHLLGYDHELGQAEEAAQVGRQNQVLDSLGITR